MVSRFSNDPDGRLERQARRKESAVEDRSGSSISRSDPFRGLDPAHDVENAGRKPEPHKPPTRSLPKRDTRSRENMLIAETVGSTVAVVVAKAAGDLDVKLKAQADEIAALRDRLAKLESDLATRKPLKAVA